ncbi:ATP-dependent metallopeptidase FtsH/Yme1/Tma family protein [Bacteroidetes/Chlorobi group bacterium ChocPot_Mid]|nr:MAG: ATP-dependent metallopeptidase FtsH/Yme1/Tma family protein [Bacteroidetes/Chlorobi group bacterium ChocPot_Mid]
MKMFRNIIIWMFIFVSIVSIYMFLNSSHKPEAPVSYTQYQEFLNENLIDKAKITKSQLNDFEFHGTLKKYVTVKVDGKHREVMYFVTKLGVLDSKTEELWASKGIEWTYEEDQSEWMNALWSILPWVVLIGVYIFFIRRMQMGGGSKGIFSFGKSKARLLTGSQNKVTFQDVAGVQEAKFELEEIIEFLKSPGKFQKLGGKIPKGVLLLGPPGTGKTLLARAVAGEANVPFFSISGADFVEMFVGVGASRVRDLFDQAKKNSPCLIFIDEIDAVGRQRGAGLGGGHDEREQTLNQLLVEMDGFEQNSGVIIIAATNRPDVLDPALLRAGRFDRQVVVDKPDIKGREGIFKVHTKMIPLGDDVDLEILARGTPGLAGADIANIVNEAALLAARRESEKVTMFDFENARDKVLMGIERKSLVISDKEKEMTAFHEMGHALVGKLIPESDPVHKVTIIPRGRALGITSYLPVEDSHSFSKSYIESRIVVLLAGRAAEKIKFNQFTTGAANDIEQATRLARKMVCDWGMSDIIGPVQFKHHQEEIFLGREISQPPDHSEETARIIDKEVRRIVNEAYEKAIKILEENVDKLNQFSKVLLEREVLDGEELDMLMKGKELAPINIKALNAIKSMKFENSESEAKIDYTEKL